MRVSAIPGSVRLKGLLIVSSRSPIGKVKTQADMRWYGWCTYNNALIAKSARGRDSVLERFCVAGLGETGKESQYTSVSYG
jgi:hypothetical protein